MPENEQIKVYQKGSLQGSIWVGAPALAILIYMAFAWKDPSSFQQDVARYIAAVTSALLAYFVTGGITLKWEPLKGIAVSASTGFALFVLVAFVPGTNPFPISPAQCERRYVSGTLTFSKSGEPPTDTLHLLVRPPEPQWDYVEHNVLRYNLPIFIDPHEGLPRLEVESDGKYWPKTFVLTPGRHNPDSDPYTVAPDSTDPRTIVISSYELQSK